MILLSSLGCKFSIHTLGIFIGPQEVGQKIEQTNTHTDLFMQISIGKIMEMFEGQNQYEDYV